MSRDEAIQEEETVPRKRMGDMEFGSKLQKSETGESRLKYEVGIKPGIVPTLTS
jgi:hypothetical protein